MNDEYQQAYADTLGESKFFLLLARHDAKMQKQEKNVKIEAVSHAPCRQTRLNLYRQARFFCCCCTTDENNFH